MPNRWGTIHDNEIFVDNNYYLKQKERFPNCRNK